MKRGGIYFGLLASLVSCHEKPVVFKELPAAIFVGYQLAGDTLHVARLLTQKGVYALHRYNLLEGRETTQRAAPVRVVPPDSVRAAVAGLAARYRWRPFSSKAPEVLFVQIEPSQAPEKVGWLSLMATMNERNSLADELEEALQQKHLGDWMASDLGPGGMNILSEVTNTAAALPVLVRTLESRRLQQRARIAHRLPTKADDWRYEVVYPLNFNGKFNSM